MRSLLILLLLVAGCSPSHVSKAPAVKEDYIAHWVCDDEYFVKGYEVEQGKDLTNFQKIGSVKATHIPGYEYLFTLPQVTGWYRIKIIGEKDSYTKPLLVTQ